MGNSTITNIKVTQGNYIRKAEHDSIAADSFFATTGTPMAN
jgi:hypothetical protein